MSFSEMSKIGIDLKNNLFTCIFGGEPRLLLREGRLSHFVALLPPIPRLPGKQGAN